MYACEVPHTYKEFTNKDFLDLEFCEYLKKGSAKKITGSMSNLYFIQPLTDQPAPETDHQSA